MQVCQRVTNFIESIYCIYPYSWAYFGPVFAIALSAIGAVCGIYLSGASILGSAIKSPRVKSKNLVSVIFCEAVAIYGVVSAVLMVMRIESYPGLIIGVCNLICGICVGVAGQSCVLTDS